MNSRDMYQKMWNESFTEVLDFDAVLQSVNTPQNESLLADLKFLHKEIRFIISENIKMKRDIKERKGLVDISTYQTHILDSVMKLKDVIVPKIIDELLPLVDKYGKPDKVLLQGYLYRILLNVIHSMEETYNLPNIQRGGFIELNSSLESILMQKLRRAKLVHESYYNDSKHFGLSFHLGKSLENIFSREEDYKNGNPKILSYNTDDFYYVYLRNLLEFVNLYELEDTTSNFPFFALYVCVQMKDLKQPV